MQEYQSDVNGITGSGKTCVTAVTLDEEPPQEHDSTPMMQRPVQVVVIHVDQLKWKRKDPQEMRKVLAAVVKAQKLHRPIVFVMDTPQPVTSQSNGSSSSNPSTSTAENVQPIQYKPLSTMPGPSSQATSPSSQEASESTFECLLQSCSTDEEFVRLISESEATSEGVSSRTLYISSTQVASLSFGGAASVPEEHLSLYLCNEAL